MCSTYISCECHTHTLAKPGLDVTLDCTSAGLFPSQNHALRTLPHARMKVCNNAQMQQCHASRDGCPCVLKLTCINRTSAAVATGVGRVSA